MSERRQNGVFGERQILGVGDCTERRFPGNGNITLVVGDAENRLISGRGCLKDAARGIRHIADLELTGGQTAGIRGRRSRREKAVDREGTGVLHRRFCRHGSCCNGTCLIIDRTVDRKRRPGSKRTGGLRERGQRRSPGQRHLARVRHSVKSGGTG